MLLYRAQGHPFWAASKNLCEDGKNNRGACQKGYLYFGAGGALGFDTTAAFAVFKLKERYHDIRLILELPCSSQIRGWTRGDMEIYEDIKQKAIRLFIPLKSAQEDVFINSIALFSRAFRFLRSANNIKW